jgi:outer membrane lipoprotein SlyB
MSRFLVLGSTIVFVLFTLTGCVSLPAAPSVLVLPGNGLSFEQFHNDDIVCKEYAYSQAGDGSVDHIAIASGITNAIVGAAIGAATGAILGGRKGAAIGAGVGFVSSGIAGASSSSASRSSYEAQQRYDAAYIQCMYGNGHQVPVHGGFSSTQTRAPINPSINIPPPPQGLPPPPPIK